MAPEELNVAWNQIDASCHGVKLVGEKAAAVCHVDRTRGSGPGHRIVTYKGRVWAYFCKFIFIKKKLARNFGPAAAAPAPTALKI